MWFKATVPGTYRHLFCAEFCGTKHSGMIGKVIAHGAAGLRSVAGSAAARPATVLRRQAGEQLFTELACITCHKLDGTQGIGPALPGVVGSSVAARRRPQTVTADDNYLRESIMVPTAKVVRGFQPVMPPFQGLVSEEQLHAAHGLHQDAEAGRRPGRALIGFG